MINITENEFRVKQIDNGEWIIGNLLNIGGDATLKKIKGIKLRQY